MSISKLASWICFGMNRISPKGEEENQVIQYGLELLLDNVIKLVLIQGLGFCLGVGLETFVILFSFCSLRLQAGGFHAQTGLGCTLLMGGMWLLSLGASRFLELPLWYLPWLYLIASWIIYCYVPRTVNLEVYTPKDILKKKVFSFFWLTFLVFLGFQSPFLRGLILYPVTLEVISLLPGYKL